MRMLRGLFSEGTVVRPTAHRPFNVISCLLALLIWVQPISAAVADPVEPLTPKSKAFIGTYVTAIALYGYNAWWKDNNQSFAVKREHWFGQDTYRGGADKIGHMFTTYASTRLLSRALQGTGQSSVGAQRYSAWLVAGTMLGVEVVDGYTQRIGFSYEDLVMDAAGIGLGLLMENHPTWDDRLDFRLHYSRSADTRRLGENDPIDDYSGQTYLLMAKLNAYPGMRRNKLLRYLELGLGYGSRGYKPSDESEQKRRKVFLALSINLNQLLDDSLYRHNNYPRAKAISETVFEYIQLPATTALADHDLD